MRIIQYDIVESTQQIARSVASTAIDMTTIVANDQTAGQGRYDRKWISGVGGLWVTWILKRIIPINKLPYLALSVGYQIYKMLVSTGFNVKIKYPNDILFGRKKLAGILCHSSIQGKNHRYSLVGIGLNINNKPPPMGISMKEILGREVDISKILRDVGGIVKIARDDLIVSKPQTIIENLKKINCLELPLDNNL